MPDARGAASPHAGRRALRPNLVAASGQLGPPPAATSEPLVRCAADMRPSILGQLVRSVVALPAPAPALLDGDVLPEVGRHLVNDSDGSAGKTLPSTQ